MKTKIIKHENFINVINSMLLISIIAILLFMFIKFHDYNIEASLCIMTLIPVFLYINFYIIPFDKFPIKTFIILIDVIILYIFLLLLPSYFI